MPQPNDSCKKIRDSALREFADANATEDRHSVIVELAAPPEIGLRSVKPGPPKRSESPKSAAKVQLTPRKSLMDKLARKISGVSQDAVRLDAAEAFVLSVTPDELRAICEIPLVGAVRPNRTHHARAAQ
jgi:hypothetical protein